MSASAVDNLQKSLYDKISKHVGKGVDIDKSLCLYSPRQVHNAIQKHSKVRNWLEFIANEYTYPKKDILLIYPCSTTKPYNKSQSYRQLYKTLFRLNGTPEIHLVTISEPFGFVPSEYYDDSFEWYDCPGLFEWWCNKHKIDYEEEYLDQSIDLLSNYVGLSLHRAVEKYKYKKIIGFVRTYTSTLARKKDHTHRRILEEASQKFGIEIELLPPPNLVKKIVDSRGHFAWDMYGPGHPIAQEYLFAYLRDKLDQGS